jgi:hypothetical protein
VDRPSVLWLTAIRSPDESKIYCVILDAINGMAGGWAIDRPSETALVNDAVTMTSES